MAISSRASKRKFSYRMDFRFSLTIPFPRKQSYGHTHWCLKVQVTEPPVRRPPKPDAWFTMLLWSPSSFLFGGTIARSELFPIGMFERGVIQRLLKGRSAYWWENVSGWKRNKVPRSKCGTIGCRRVGRFSDLQRLLCFCWYQFVKSASLQNSANGTSDDSWSNDRISINLHFQGKITAGTTYRE